MEDNQKEGVPTKKNAPVEEKRINCYMCMKGKAVTTIVMPLSNDTVNVCSKCYDDIMDEENE